MRPVAKSGGAAPADDEVTHEVAGAQPFRFELNGWFPELATLVILASVLVGFVAKMGEQETVRLVAAGASDMMGPALVAVLAGGVSAGFFVFLTVLVNIPPAFRVPSIRATLRG